MLIHKVFINEELIDIIAVGRIENFKTSKSYHKYKILLPMGYDMFFISHKYSDGRNVLMIKVLTILDT